MIRKAALAITLGTLIAGCTPTDPEPCMDYETGGVSVVTNQYTRVTFETYTITYKDGVIHKEFDKNVTIPTSYDARVQQRRGIEIAWFEEECDPKPNDFYSFFTIAHLDENTTYTIAGFTEAMDSEHNITGGKGADTYYMGYVQYYRYYSEHQPYYGIIEVDINATGHLTFSEGRGI